MARGRQYRYGRPGAGRLHEAGHRPYRPPLPRESPHGTFMSVVEVSPDHRSVAIMEYLGQEIEEKERARDIE